ncbi:ABC transporter ATP-binding protein [Rhodococcus sp. USK13]|uniref:ABC transporter ATP-binding protein n=1 Tax=Rhodococcus sp. USK13 TaxID=2806442 RepID=UPI001BCC7E51|nr:ABC transporter ATP-binding protein [Rhodococcus sp. USK13]
MASAISVRALTKKFGDVLALDGLDLTVQSGEVHGLLGPGGSGKTTTIRVLLGLLRPGGGTARVLGQDPWRNSVSLHRRVAYVPGEVALWPGLTGGQAIDVLGRLRSGVDPALCRSMIERFELDPTRKGRTYSKGDRQKIALVAALAADSELLVLDEPMSGLDPMLAAVFRECVAEFAAGGGTVLLSSHSLAEIDTLCSAVTIIRAGRTVQAGKLSDLRGCHRTTVTATTRIRPHPIGNVPGVHNLRGGDDRHTVTFDVDPEQLDPVLTTLTGLGIVSIVANPPTLEDVLRRENRGEAKVLAGGQSR